MKYEEAIPHLQKSIGNNQQHLRAQVYLGVCYMGVETWEKAITELHKALEMDEKYPLTNYALSVSYARKENPDLEKAKKFLAHAKEYGYHVPIWFENYLVRLEMGKISPPATPPADAASE